MSTTDHLAEMLAAQNLLQIESYGTNPRTLLQNADDRNAPEAVEFVSWNVQAAVDELHELLNETGWKPWAASQHVNIAAAKGELIDVLHFVLNLANVLGMSAEEVHERYMAKRAKNAQRQADGYDGVATKCPQCKRALDDDAVLCSIVWNEADQRNYSWCTEALSWELVQ